MECKLENEGIEWFGRLDGPLNLRLLLQPTIAAMFGYRDGIADALNGAPPYCWNVTHVLPGERQQLRMSASDPKKTSQVCSKKKRRRNYAARPLLSIGIRLRFRAIRPISLRVQPTPFAPGPRLC